MDFRSKQTRFKRIKWTIKILQNVNLELQTVQLIFLLTDCISSLKEFESTKLELLSISCIYLILKLQGDLTASLTEFNDFVTKKLEIPRSSILRTELLILEAMPASFVFIHSFSDFLVSYFPQLLHFRKENYEFTRKVSEVCMGYYCFSGSPVKFENIIAAGIEEGSPLGGVQLGINFESLKKNCEGVCDFNLKEIAEIRSSFLSDNPYIRAIFNEGPSN